MKLPITMVACSLLAMALPRTARALAWFEFGSRALPMGESASPDAPYIGLGYGPRASSRLGADLALLTFQRPCFVFRWGLSAMVAFDNATTRNPVSGELGRSSTELSLAWSFPGMVENEQARVVEFAFLVGRRTAFATERYDLVEPRRSDDVPFGAGGNYLGLEGALRQPLRDWLQGTLRLGLRAYLNSLADVVGAREASDGIADYLHEGAEWQTWMEAGLRVWPQGKHQPFATIHAELIGPHDDTAKHLWLARMELGWTFAGAPAQPSTNNSKNPWALAPFAALEAGHGPSLLVNRTELRLAVGVKLYAR